MTLIDTGIVHSQAPSAHAGGVLLCAKCLCWNPPSLFLIPKGKGGERLQLCDLNHSKCPWRVGQGMRLFSYQANGLD
jgi:hypothetical protein